MTKVSRSSWYQKEAGSGQKNMAPRGRPIAGYTMNRDGTLILDRTVVCLLRRYRDQVEFSNAGGYQKLKHYLRRDYGFFINHKKLYRLCKEHGLLLPRNRKKRKKNRKICLNRVITAPHQLWEFDIKYGYIHGENRFFYLLTFIDVFTRRVMDYHMGLSCKAGDLKFTLDQALKKAKIQDDSGLVIRSDNGPQMTSFQFRESLKNLEITMEHEFIPPGCSNKNAHIESFHSIFEIEFLQVRYFKSYGEAYQQTAQFMEYYDKRRLHGSLKMLPPAAAEGAWFRGELHLDEVRV